MPFPFTLPPDSEPIIRGSGSPRSLCIAVGLLCLLLIAIVAMKISGG